MMFAMLVSLLLKVTISFAEDPRLEIEDVLACTNTAKSYLDSSDYSGEGEKDLIGACRDAEPVCVQEVLESYRPIDNENRRDHTFKLIRLCRGKGMGKCFTALKQKTASFNRREFSQLEALLKRCD